MKKCPPSVGKCGGNWIQRHILRFPTSGGGGEPPLGYGLLYNAHAVLDVRGVAPDGFSIPTQADFQTLSAFLGGDLVSGGKMKSIRSISDGHPYWVAPNTAADNSSGFNAFPAGDRRGFNGAYAALTTTTMYATTDAGSVGNGIKTAGLSTNNAILGLANEGTFRLTEGVSIRCVRETEPPSPTVTDASGNTYTWVQIGSQYWLAQNLKTTKYNNGDPIPTGLDNAAWAATTDGAWAYPNGDSNLPI